MKWIPNNWVASCYNNYADEAYAAESKVSPMQMWFTYSVPVIIGFFLPIWLGHFYAILLVCLQRMGLSCELFNVRYKLTKELEEVLRSSSLELAVLRMQRVSLSEVLASKSEGGCADDVT